MSNKYFLPKFLALIAALALVVGCSSSSETEDAAAPAPTDTCSAESLETLTPGVLTIATGEPAYYPWVLDDKPESGEGFEPAVAYAVAAELGFAADAVTWVRTTFDGAIAPGTKTFDFNLQQFSITEDRKKAVDFSSSYYDSVQTVISYAGSKIENATSLADLKSAVIGAAVGTTSLDAAESQIAPTKKVQVFNDNAAAVTALKNKQIDGIVVDLPTAFYLTGVEIEGGKIIGQLASNGTVSDQFGLLLAKGSPLTKCVTQAVDTLRSNGSLAAIEDQWLTQFGNAPVLN